MQLHYQSVSEPTLPGPKWVNLFNTFWGGYRAWLDSKGAAYNPDLTVAQAALKKHMPEMVQSYEHFCHLVEADEAARCFLTGFQPPAYISACSQAVTTENQAQLVRNYDYHPDLIEGTLFMSAWNGKKVIANSDCLIGALDGMNEDGLAISLAFGGRQVVGKGFGIPFILRYVLEFCSNVAEAVEALIRIPSHMAYNVTVIDKTGVFKTVHLSPDRAPKVTDAAFATNHQGTVDWPENAEFNKTIERFDYLDSTVLKQKCLPDSIPHFFLQPPLYNTQFADGFGTLYTAVYRPEEGIVQLLWPNYDLQQSFDHFHEAYHIIPLGMPLTSAEPAGSPLGIQESAQVSQVKSARDEKKDVERSERKKKVSVRTAIPTPPSLMPGNKKKVQKRPKKIQHQGEASWDSIATHWIQLGAKYWAKWMK